MTGNRPNVFDKSRNNLRRAFSRFTEEIEIIDTQTQGSDIHYDTSAMVLFEDVRQEPFRYNPDTNYSLEVRVREIDIPENVEYELYNNQALVYIPRTDNTYNIVDTRTQQIFTVLEVEPESANDL